MQITIQIRSHLIRFIIRIYGRRYFFFYWMNDIYKTPFKVVEWLETRLFVAAL